VRRIAAFAASAAALVPGVLAAAGTPAHAAGTAGPTPLTTGPGANLDRLALVGASGDNLVYVRTHVDRSGFYRASDDLYAQVVGAAPRKLPRWDADRAVPTQGLLAGTMLIQTMDDADGTKRYVDTASGLTGTVTLADGQTFLGAAPDGWLAAGTDADGVPHVYDVAAATGDAADLGTPPGWDAGMYTTTVGDPAGAVLTYAADTGNVSAYVAYAAPGAFTALAVDPAADWVTCVGLVADAAGCVEHLPSDPPVIARVPLDGGDAVRTAPDDAYLDERNVALTADETAWVDSDGNLAVQPAAGGPVTPGPTGVAQVASTGTGFVYTTGGPYSDAALHTLSSAGGDDEVLAGPQHSPAVAGGIAVGSGRVAWNDDATGGNPVWTRPLSGAGAPLSAGAPSLAATRSTGTATSLSGRRTAFFAPDATRPTSDTAVLDVATGGTVTPIATDDAFAGDAARMTLSGTRLLYRTSAGWRLRDLRPGGATTSLDDLSGALSAQLWGNYVAWLLPDGSVWRRDLTSAADATQLVAPTDGATDADGYVLTWGDWVAWRWTYTSCDTGCTQVVQAGYRNAATMDPAAELPAGVDPASLGGEGLVESGLSESGAGATLRNLATGAETPLAAVGQAPRSAVVADQGVAAWVDESGTPVVSALPTHTAAAPRSLGNAAGQLTAVAGKPWSWAGEVVASAPFTSCAVRITSGAAVVRTLPCDAAGAAQGDALVTWDGRNAAGVAVAAGAYTWTLVAGNRDGALLAADGSATPVTGTIARTVPAVKPAVTRQPASRTVAAGQRAVFTAAASGSPAPTVQWQASANGGRTWANLSGQRSATLSVKATRALKGYRYRAAFANKSGTAYTAAAVLTVR
jgi:hypothetical protein